MTRLDEDCRDEPQKRARRLMQLALAALLLCLPCHAYAIDAIGQVMCNVVKLTAGTTGKAICTVNVIAIGIGALLGKISWNKAMIACVGIALLFGSASVVDALSYNYDPLFGAGGTGGGGIAVAAAAQPGGGNPTGTGAVTLNPVSTSLAPSGDQCVPDGTLVAY